MTVDPGQMVPQNPPFETPASVAASPRHGGRPGVATVEGSAATPGSIPEPALVEDDLLLIGVAWYRVALARDGKRLVLEGPLNSHADGGLW